MQNHKLAGFPSLGFLLERQKGHLPDAPGSLRASHIPGWAPPALPPDIFFTMFWCRSTELKPTLTFQECSEAEESSTQGQNGSGWVGLS